MLANRNGLHTCGSWFSLFQVSRGSHRNKLNLISRYHTHYRARSREALRFPPAIRFSALRAFGGRHCTADPPCGQVDLPLLPRAPCKRIRYRRAFTDPRQRSLFFTSEPLLVNRPIVRVAEESLRYRETLSTEIRTNTSRMRNKPVSNACQQEVLVSLIFAMHLRRSRIIFDREGSSPRKVLRAGFRLHETCSRYLEAMDPRSSMTRSRASVIDKVIIDDYLKVL